MSKRKKSQVEKQSKKQKLAVENVDPEDEPNITQLSWSDSDLLKLISKIEENIPEDDAISYATRLGRINWNDITLKKHSAKECHEIWTSLLKQVRKFRLLREIIEDMKEYVKTVKPPPSEEAPARQPDKPKQPWNSYLFFAEDVRHQVMMDHPDLSPNDVARKMGQMFKDLSQHQRQKYQRQANLAKEEYSEKLRNYYKEHPEKVPKKNKKRSKQKEGPEKPKTPFQLFMQVEAEKEEVEERDKSAFNQRCRERWKELLDKDKLFWIKWAEEQFEKYKEDLKEFLKVHPDYEPETLKSILTKKEKRIKARCGGRPQKPPRSAYHLFSKMMMESEEIQKIGPREASRYVAEKWKASSEEEKGEYKTRLEQMWEEYDGKLDRYLMTLPPDERSKIEEQEGNRRRKSHNDKVKQSVENKTKIELPKVPPLSDYKYFLSVYQGEENPSEVWENMTEEEKKIYERELEEKKRVYIAQYEQYLKSLSKEELQQFRDGLRDRYDTSTSSDSDDAASEEVL